MVAMLSESYRVLAVISGAAIPATLLDDGLSAIDKGGIIGLLMMFAALFVGLWRSADKAKENMYKAISAEDKQRIQELEAKIEIERMRK